MLIKINRCISLLDDEYKSLNFTIDIYKNRERLEYEWKNKPELNDFQYKQILNGETEAAGITIGDKKKIKIFLFMFDNVESNPKEAIDFIGNVYHEIRHAWQTKNRLFQDEEEISTIDGNQEAYFKQPSEKDAYLFQLEQMKKHANTILRIFNFNSRLQSYALKDEIMNAINHE